LALIILKIYIQTLYFAYFSGAFIGQYLSPGLKKQHRIMSLSVKKIFARFLKITGITLASIILLLFLIPYLFPGFVSGKIKGLVNSTISGQLDFSKARLSFFNHFPSLTLTLYDFNLKGSAPFQQDALVSANELSFGIYLKSLLSKKVKVDEIYLTNAFINIQVDSAGNANYNVYKSKPSTTSNAEEDTSTTIKIEKILIEKSNIVYNDRSLPMLIKANGINYSGKGRLQNDTFALVTQTEIDSLDLYYDNEAYLFNKKINASLITKINTSSLAFIFQKNDLHINQLPVTFTGKFEFLKSGYSMDFKMRSNATNLHDIITAMPSDYTQWLQNTEVSGDANLDLSLTGDYIAATNTMPSLIFNASVRNGSIANNKAPSPVKNIFLNFQSSLPGLNPDSLKVDIDSVYFNIDNDYVSSIIKLQGISSPKIYAKTNALIDLEKWDRAIGFAPLDFKGKLDLHLLANGIYATKVVESGIRKKDTVLASIPSFNLKSTLQNGYVKYASLPQAVTNIGFTLDATCPDNNINHARFNIDNINANALTNFIKGFVHIKNGAAPVVDAGITSLFHLADIKQFYPVDSIEMKGDLYTDIKSKGVYDADKRLFPVTKAVFTLKDGSIQTKYYPHPIENIQVNATVINTTGNLKGMNIDVKPVAFKFEGKPFTIKADLKNFDDLKYSIASNGVVDLGKVYQVFSKKGYNITGYIKTNFSLAGLQSDAVSGHYDKLFNKGTMQVKNIRLSADAYPLPFFIKTGNFRFDQDKMWFDSFNASYGKTGIALNGYLANVIGYATQKDAPLQGNFNFTSNHVMADEFTAFANTSTPAAKQPAAAETGVVVVPANLSLTFNADAKAITYNSIDLHDFKGEMVIDSGKIKLNKTGFVIVDAPVTMDASYASVTPKKALFSYHINVAEFDIQKAYTQIKLFRDMATSAGSAQGVVSLDYTLAGRLDANMKPVYPSLKGGGTLSLKKVKVKGLKLFGEVSKATNRKDINDPDLSKVDIKTTINNNIITISRTKMRVFGFRPRFEGQVSFDGALNLQFRLGLPPFGIFGIPMSITGTEDKPKIKLGRGKEELQEKDDDGGNVDFGTKQ